MPDQLTADYMNETEAAEYLGTSRQYVHKIIKQGKLNCVRPWPRAVRIARSEVEAWGSGHRPTPITPRAAARYVMDLTEGDSIESVESETLRLMVLQFLESRRPEWTTEQRVEFAERLVVKL